MASSDANVLQQENVFTCEKSLTHTGLVWDTNMVLETGRRMIRQNMEGTLSIVAELF